MAFMENWRRRGLLLFRGESKKYEVPLSPGIARKKLPEGALEPFQNYKHFTIYEYSQIQECQKDYQDGEFEDIYLKAFSPAIPHDDVNWLPLAQHHKYDTRLLDVTMDILVALYFACDNHESNDGFVYMFSKDSFIYHAPDMLPINYHSLFENPIDENHGHFFIPNIPNVRLSAQRGGFLWRSPIGEPMHSSNIPNHQTLG